MLALLVTACLLSVNYLVSSLGSGRIVENALLWRTANPCGPSTCHPLDLHVQIAVCTYVKSEPCFFLHTSVRVNGFLVFDIYIFLRNGILEVGSSQQGNLGASV